VVTDTAGDTPAPRSRRVLVISGLSGAGKTSVTKLFEDLGYSTMDNLPTALLPELADVVARDRGPQFDRVAIVVDARAGDVPGAFAAMMDAFAARAIRPQVLFLEARDDVLIRRFSETRHRHPLAGAGSERRSIEEAIEAERAILADVRERADVIVDTSDLSYRELRERVVGGLDLPAERLAVQLVTFGYKHGIPLESDLVFDVRFLRNPFYEAELRELDGRDAPVRDFVLSQPGVETFVEMVGDMLDFLIPLYAAEGKSTLTVAFGCTGGQHRSIAIAEELARRLHEAGVPDVAVFHRELGGT
jgi:RNase adapter protein RapZ